MRCDCYFKQGFSSIIHIQNFFLLVFDPRIIDRLLVKYIYFCHDTIQHISHFTISELSVRKRKINNILEAEAVAHPTVLWHSLTWNSSCVMLWIMGCMVSSGTYSAHCQNIHTGLRMLSTIYNLYKYHIEHHIYLNNGGYCTYILE